MTPKFYGASYARAQFAQRVPVIKPCRLRTNDFEVVGLLVRVGASPIQSLSVANPALGQYILSQ